MVWMDLLYMEMCVLCDIWEVHAYRVAHIRLHVHTEKFVQKKKQGTTTRTLWSNMHFAYHSRDRQQEGEQQNTV